MNRVPEDKGHLVRCKSVLSLEELPDDWRVCEEQAITPHGEQQPHLQTSACQVDAPDISYTPLRSRNSNADVTRQLASYLRRRGTLQPADDDAAESSLSAKGNVKLAKPLLAGAEHYKGLSCRQILPWIFIVLCLTLVAVLQWPVAVSLHFTKHQHSLNLGHVSGVISSLSARNRALTNQYLALHKAMHALQSKINNVCALSSVQDYNVRKVVEQQLAVYDADKIGLADYALESQGGAVLDTPDTVTYYPDSWFELLGFPLFRYGPCSGPSCILQPSMQPGNCWAFRGTRGSVKIRLARRIHIIAVTMEHIPRSIAISGDVSSAPKKFLIAALVPGPGKSFSSHTLGMYEYNISGPPLQSFRTQNAEFSETTSLLQLSVLENHGNPTYTCIYRFRVHGHEALVSPSGGGLP